MRPFPLSPRSSHSRPFADRTSLEPEKLEKFIHFVEEDLGYDLYRSVNSTKASLSDHEVAELAFDSSGIAISSQVSRSGFDRWIDEDLQKISKYLDQALDRAGLSAAQIDRVSLTGGTSLVPAVQQLLRSRFPAHRVNSGDQLVSVASGLALIGQDRNLNQWTISES